MIKKLEKLTSKSDSSNELLNLTAKRAKHMAIKYGKSKDELKDCLTQISQRASRGKRGADFLQLSLTTQEELTKLGYKITTNNDYYYVRF